MITVDAWKPADGLILEPNAMRAVKEQVCCLALTAGPGAGKRRCWRNERTFYCARQLPLPQAYFGNLL